MKHALLPFVLLLIFQMATGQVAENDPAFVITGTGFNGTVRAMAVQGDGKVIVGGDFTSYNGTTRNYIARLNADGTLDGSFDAASTLGAAVLDVAIDASGNIICGGSFAASVKRLLPTGANDATFALVGTGLNAPVNAVAVQSDGTVYIAGNFTSYNGTSRNRIARLLSTGALDTGFDPGTGLNGFARKIGLQADGKIVVVGGSSGFSSYNGTTRDNIVRIESTGAIDAGFVPPTNLLARLYDVKFQSDNKVIITGEYNGSGSSIFNGVARLNTNGSLDNTFSADFFQGGRSILIQADGKIVIGGLTFPKAIKRVNSNGTTDTFFDGFDGFVKSGGAEVTSLVLQDGKILAAGDFDVFNGYQRNRMARIKTCTSVGITSHPANQNVCAGAVANLSVVATGSGLTYQWQRRNVADLFYQNLSDGTGISGALTATLTINTATAPTALAYRCLVTDANCTSTSRGAEVVISPLPVINTQPQPQTVCTGTNAVFSVSATNASVYVWQEDQGQGFVDLAPSLVYLNPGSATLTLVTNAASLNGYKYRCKVGTCTPSLFTNEVLLTVNNAPAITAQPASLVSICTGGNAQFSVTATNAATYQWQEKVGSGAFANITDGGIYGGATTATLVFTGATVTQNSNQYRCIVSSATACPTTSGTGTLGVYASPTVSTHPANANQCSGTNAQFVVAVTSPPAGITYQWQERVTGGSFTNIANGGIYSGATTTTLTVSSVTLAMDGNAYRCVVGTCATPVTSFEASLTVYQALQITTQPSAVVTCPNTDATFTVASAGTATYQWQEQLPGGSFLNIINGGGYSGATTATLTVAGVTSSKNGNRYRCALSNGTCTPVNSNNVLLTVRATPTITNHPTNKTFCGTNSTTFSVTASNHFDTYQWQVTDAAGAFVDVANGGVYSGATTNILTLTNATPALNGKQFRCVVGPCADKVQSNTATLTIHEPPTVTTSPVASTICSGGATSFSVAATGTSLTYKWIINGGGFVTDNSIYSGSNSATLTITGATMNMNNNTYTAQLAGPSGCPTAESAAAKLTVNEITITTQPAAAAAFCEGGNASYTVVASGTDLTYQWQSQTGTGAFANVTGTVYGGATSATLSITGAPISLHGTNYRCVVSGLCQGVNTNPVTLQMIQKPAKPVIVVDLSNPESPTLSAPGSSVNGWKWFKNGTQTSTSSQLQNPGEGSYTVIVSNQGCESVMSDARTIIVTGSSYVKESRVSLYPNPAATTLMVSLSEFKSGEEVDIMLVDMLGRSIERTSGTGGGEKEINVSRFQAGRYMVRMQQGQQQLVSHFIKTNQ